MTMRPPAASAFRDRLTIERRGTASDGMGGSSEAWSTTGLPIAAAVREQRGGEQVKSNRLSSIAAVDIWLRASPSLDIQETDRLRDRRTNTVYSVKWVGNMDDDRRFILVAATRGEIGDGQ